jgi:hypothetical protein
VKPKWTVSLNGLAFPANAHLLMLFNDPSGADAAARWDCDGGFDPSPGATNTWHIAVAYCCNTPTLPLSLTTINS